MIHIDGSRFEELAERLKMTPEAVIDVFLDNLHNPPPCITTRAMNSGSLKNSMEDLINNSEAAYTMGSLIKNVVGDRDYWIDESGYDVENGVFTFGLSFGKEVTMDSVLLQFGDAPLELVSASVDDVVLDNDVDFLNEIHSVLDDLDDEYEFSHEWVGDNYLSFMIQIELVGMGALVLPKMDDVEPVVRKIKEIIKNHDSRKQNKNNLCNMMRGSSDPFHVACGDYSLNSCKHDSQWDWDGLAGTNVDLHPVQYVFFASQPSEISSTLSRFTFLLHFLQYGCAIIFPSLFFWYPNTVSTSSCPDAVLPHPSGGSHLTNSF